MKKLISIFFLILLLSVPLGSPAAAQDGITITDLGTLGGNWSYAFGINDRGQVVGYGQTASGEIHAFMWENGDD